MASVHAVSEFFDLLVGARRHHDDGGATARRFALALAAAAAGSGVEYEPEEPDEPEEPEEPSPGQIEVLDMRHRADPTKAWKTRTFEPVGVTLHQMVIGLPLPFLAPIFAVALLVPASAPPDPLKLIALPIVAGVVAFLVDAVGGFLAPMLDVLVLVFALVLFVCFHADALRGPGPIVGLVLTVTLIVGTLAANAESSEGEVVRSLIPSWLRCAAPSTS